MAKKNANKTIDSLEALEARKDEISADIAKSEEKLSAQWDLMFPDPSEEDKNSPTQKALSFVTSSAGLIDGVIFGWKLYNRYKRGRIYIPFLNRKKKK